MAALATSGHGGAARSYACPRCGSCGSGSWLPCAPPAGNHAWTIRSAAAAAAGGPPPTTDGDGALPPRWAEAALGQGAGTVEVEATGAASVGCAAVAAVAACASWRCRPACSASKRLRMRSKLAASFTSPPACTGRVPLAADAAAPAKASFPVLPLLPVAPGGPACACTSPPTVAAAVAAASAAAASSAAFAAAAFLAACSAAALAAACAAVTCAHAACATASTHACSASVACWPACAFAACTRGAAEGHGRLGCSKGSKHADGAGKSCACCMHTCAHTHRHWRCFGPKFGYIAHGGGSPTLMSTACTKLLSLCPTTRYA